MYARAGFNGATLDDVAAEAGFTKGAVYGHFGSKENLLVALVDEHLSRQIVEQISLIDRTGSHVGAADRRQRVWIAQLRADPDPFRLFVELWVHAQRDERLRERLAHGLDALRTMFIGFATDSAHDAGLPSEPEAIAAVRGRGARACPLAWPCSRWPTPTRSRPRCSASRCRCSSRRPAVQRRARGRGWSPSAAAAPRSLPLPAQQAQ